MSQYQLSWTSFKNSLCNGFSKLQQNEEFVDMTLAADGHLVKVHRNIMSVASPYIKEMLQSTTCQDPIVFLNDVSSHVLSYILEYIYTGEVKVPKHTLSTFIKAAKSLHIAGIKDLIAPMVPQELSQPLSKSFPKRCARLAESTAAVEIPSYAVTDKNEENPVAEKYGTTSKLQDTQRHCDTINIETDDNNMNNLDIDLMDFDIAQPQTTKGFTQMFNSQTLQEKSLLEKAMENIEIVDANKADHDAQYKANITVNFEDNGGVRLQNDGESSAPNFDFQIHSCQRDNENEYPMISISVNKNNQISDSVPDSLAKVNTKDASAPLYSISSRRSLQLILNRFIYNMHHSSHGNKKRRWRCADYRKLNCKAYIDTFCEEIVERTNEHSHGFHDGKILKKESGRNIYSTIEGAEAAAKTEALIGI